MMMTDTRLKVDVIACLQMLVILVI